MLMFTFSFTYQCWSTFPVSNLHVPEESNPKKIFKFIKISLQKLDKMGYRMLNHTFNLSPNGLWNNRTSGWDHSCKLRNALNCHATPL